MKEFLSERHVLYVLRNVTKDPDALREFRERGFLLPPVVVVDGRAVTGFAPDKLDALLFPDARPPS